MGMTHMCEGNISNIVIVEFQITVKEHICKHFLHMFIRCGWPNNHTEMGQGQCACASFPSLYIQKICWGLMYVVIRHTAFLNVLSHGKRNLWMYTSCWHSLWHYDYELLITWPMSLCTLTLYMCWFQNMYRNFINRVLLLHCNSTTI